MRDYANYGTLNQLYITLNFYQQGVFLFDILEITTA